uniref:Uncharacterized protein n=1 Tax=Ditylenchus dipsaci TaxID=166011 RepID=A0A915D816_9BILA
MPGAGVFCFRKPCKFCRLEDFFPYSCEYSLLRAIARTKPEGSASQFFHLVDSNNDGKLTKFISVEVINSNTIIICYTFDHEHRRRYNDRAQTIIADAGSHGKPISSSKAEPLRPLTNLSPEKPLSISRKSKFAALAADLDQFEYDLPERNHKKESLLKGPSKRVSMGGETRASILFAPGGNSATEKGSPINRGPAPYLPPSASSFAFVEEDEKVEQPSSVPKEPLSDSIIVEEWEESPKHFVSVFALNLTLTNHSNRIYNLSPRNSPLYSMLAYI